MENWLNSLGVDAEPDMQECLTRLGNLFPLLHQLSATEQDPEWHAEGDVFIHTGMVLQELYKILRGEAAFIQGARRQMLILGAIFHDIAKPLATNRREIKGIERVVSPRHEERGRAYLAFKIMSLPLPHDVIRGVLSLVGEHHMPKLLVAKNAEKGAYIRLAQRADLELLYFLELADMRGRTCADLPTQLEILEFFRLQYQEYELVGEENLFQQWRGFVNQNLEEHSEDLRDLVYGVALRDLADGKISHPEEALARTYELRSALFPRLVMLFAPAGSGKSTWIQNNLPDYEVISMDNLRQEFTGNQSSQKLNSQVLHQARFELKKALRAGARVAWDATGIRREFRDEVAAIGFGYDALVTQVVLQQPESELFRRNRSREDTVPDTVLNRQLERMQWPLESEVHRTFFVNGEGNPLHYAGFCAPRDTPFSGEAV